MNNNFYIAARVFYLNCIKVSLLNDRENLGDMCGLERGDKIQGNYFF